MLKKDKAYAPFSILGLEKDVAEKFEIVVDGEKVNLNIGGQIDRLDRSDKGLRVIDYKTGGDKLVFDDLDDVFNEDKIKDTKAIFQTFVYSYLLNQQNPDEIAILPMVYQVKKMFEEQGSFAISSKKYAPFAAGNFVSIKSEVGNKLRELLQELFDKDIPFIQTENISVCEYCPHKSKCGR
jgi:ATP-dependent helicase/nuclease subunit B